MLYLISSDTLEPWILDIVSGTIALDGVGNTMLELGIDGEVFTTITEDFNKGFYAGAGGCWIIAGEIALEGKRMFDIG